MKSPKTTWPADKVERRTVESLVPYARNARTHSDAQVAQIAASITEWGYCDVIVKRWQDFTGQKATLESDGRTFEDVAAARYDWKQDATGSYDAAIAEKRKELTDARA